MKPTVKSEAVEQLIQNLSGEDRRESIYNNRCVKPPIGCGKTISPELDFRNEISRKEFTISSLCQNCQDTVFGYDEPDTPIDFWPEQRPKPKYQPTENDFVIERMPMRSGQGDAQSKRYRKYIGSSGKIWLVADQENAADNIYVEGGPNSDGFGGSTLTFPLVDGEEIKLKGPWHTNSGALYADTGVDIRNQTYTMVVVGKGVEYGDYGCTIITNVIHHESEAVLGSFDRDKEITNRLLTETGLDKLFVYQQSSGGAHYGFQYAEGQQPIHCKDCMSWHQPEQHTKK